MNSHPSASLDRHGRRSALRAMLAATSVALLGGAPALAQDPYPSKPARIVVPFAAGGSGDVVTRMIAQRLSARLGQSFVVENKPGAGGSIGPGIVARSPADGYTLAFVSSGYAWLAATYPSLSFNTSKDLIPVAYIGSVPYAVLTRKDSPFKTVPEMIAYAKANPGKVTFATAGAGTLTHLLPVWLAVENGVTLNHIPYGGTAPAMNSLLAGQVDLYFDPLSTSKPHIAAGTVRALATTGLTRSRSDLPTLAELGYKARGATWFALMAPAGTPKAIVEKINHEVNAVLNEEAIKQKLVAMDFTVEPMSTEKYGSFLESEMATWTKVIKDNNIKSD